ncbi:MAG: hypothetical protein B7Z33_13390 [Sphingomonadales bacterium 12-68-11]|nr:MAG: hypothetical protein B7Z33_13390 [Sphingomonadales bacterium 12-68-11]
MLSATPAAAQTEVESATQLRRLDMMLMVTSLRCRFGSDNFQAGYEAFKRRHAATLRTAAEQALADMTRRMGRKSAIHAFDRLSTGMANSYGLGHPQLGCAELKQAAEHLLTIDGRPALVAAANSLLDGGDGATLLAQR